MISSRKRLIKTAKEFLSVTLKFDNCSFMYFIFKQIAIGVFKVLPRNNSHLISFFIFSTFDFELPIYILFPSMTTGLFRKVYSSRMSLRYSFSVEGFGSRLL